LLSTQGIREIPFTLNYNSLFAAVAGGTGAGWSHNYAARLIIDDDLRTVVWGPGQRNTFRRTTDNNYLPQDEAARYDTLIRRNTGFPWLLTRQDGSYYEFDNVGVLRTIGNKVQQEISLRRDPQGRLNQLLDPISDRRLILTYAKDRPELIETIYDGISRTVFFEYDSQGRLAAIRNPAVFGHEQFGPPMVQVQIPDNSSTGVTIPINVTETGFAGLVKINSLSLIHDRPRDIRVFLTSPSGRRTEFRRPAAGNSGEEASFAGTITGTFEGERLRGEWRLQIVDAASGSTGTISGANLMFTGPTFPTYLTYDASGRILTAVDAEEEQLFANTYDAAGRVATQDDGVGTNLIATFEYRESSNNIETTYTDRSGAGHVYVHDAAYHLLRYTNPLGHSVRRTYDNAGNCSSYTDALDRTTVFAYDADGNLTRATDPASASTTYTYDRSRNLTTIQDALGKTSTFEYDGKNNMIAVRDAARNRDRRPYNSFSQKTGTLLQDGAGINYRYSNGLLQSANHPGGSGSVRNEYDNTGRVTKLIDADDNETLIDYDHRSNVVRRTDPLSRRREFFFDHRNRQIRAVEPSGATTDYGYDGNDNLISVTGPLGQTTRYIYDMEDRRTATVDPAGNMASREYDEAGEVVAEHDATGNTAFHEYDAAGNRIRTRNEAGDLIAQISYDSRDQLVQRVDAAGVRGRIRYDLLGRASELRDGLDATTTIDFDELDRPVRVREPLGRVLTREYAPDDVVTSQKGPGDNEREFRYDAANRVTVVLDPAAGRTEIDYNGRDLVTSYETPTRRSRFTYDSAGQLTRIVRTGSNPDVENSGETIAYSYDRDGRLTETARTPGGGGSSLRLRRVWDTGGRLTQFTDEAGQSVGYSYDAAGNLSEIRYPDGSRVRYAYDAARRLTRVTDWAGRVTRMDWNANGLLQAVHFPNGASRRMQYDAAGRALSRIELAANGEAIASFRYTYDAAGRLTDETGISLQPSELTGLEAAYTAGRLEHVAGRPVSYDGAGKITRVWLAGGQQSFRYDAAGRLSRVGPSEITYDSEDRLTSFRTAAGLTRFTYNPLARLSQVLVSDAPNGTTRYVHGTGLLYSERNGEIQVHHYDERGSTIGFTGASGSVTGRLSYTPFGSIAARSGQTDSLFLLNGLFGVVSADDSLVWMRYRWYSPELRRFLSADSRLGDFSDPASMNRYSFLGNQPAMRVDPDGEFWWVAAGALIGAVANVAVQVASDVVSGKVSDWQTYAGAAVSGAIVGAGVALCPACGIAGSALIGAAGAAAGYAVTQGLRGDSVSAEGLLAEAALGGVGGGFAGGAGRIGSKAVGKLGSKLGPKFLGKLSSSGKTLARRAVNGRLAIIKQAARQEAGRGLIRGGLQAGFTRAAEITGVGRAVESGALGVGSFVAALYNGSSIPSTLSPRLRYQAAVEGTQMLNENSKGVYGEFIHWQQYLEFLRLAMRPEQANPNNLLTVF
jgi:RHS repeat-associated protein